jgi:hypothetical protein
MARNVMLRWLMIHARMGNVPTKLLALQRSNQYLNEKNAKEIGCKLCTMSIRVVLVFKG